MIWNIPNVSSGTKFSSMKRPNAGKSFSRRSVPRKLTSSRTMVLIEDLTSASTIRASSAGSGTLEYDTPLWNQTAAARTGRPRART